MDGAVGPIPIQGRNLSYEEAVERDQGRCRGCGQPSTQVHHITFRSAGGDESLGNLVSLCDLCHRRAHGLEKRTLTKQELRAVIRTQGNVLGFRLRMICYSCVHATLGPLGNRYCEQWEMEVEPDMTCGMYRRGNQSLKPWML